MYYFYTYTYNQYKFFFLAPQCSATDRWLKVLPGDLQLKQTHLSHMQRCKMCLANIFFSSCKLNLCYIALLYFIPFHRVTFYIRLHYIASNFYALTIAIFGGNLTTFLVVVLNHNQWKKNNDDHKDHNNNNNVQVRPDQVSLLPSWARTSPPPWRSQWPIQGPVTKILTGGKLFFFSQNLRVIRRNI